jgi:hypothetical protein
MRFRRAKRTSRPLIRQHLRPSYPPGSEEQGKDHRINSCLHICDARSVLAMLLFESAVALTFRLCITVDPDSLWASSA